jgi:hypothetical protein
VDASGLSAIGALPNDGTWVGLSRDHRGYRLAFGPPGASVLLADASRQELLALAIAYFEDDLEDPPPDLEATQRDMGDLCRWLADSELRPEIASLLREAVDAIDDGLAADVTVGRLNDALRADERNEQADVLDLLVRRYRSLIGE